MLTDLRSCVRCENLTIDTAAFREISNLRNSWQIVFAPIGPGPNFFKSAAPKHYKTKHKLKYVVALVFLMLLFIFLKKSVNRRPDVVFMFLTFLRKSQNPGLRNN